MSEGIQLKYDLHSFTCDQFLACEACDLITYKARNGNCRKCGAPNDSMSDASMWSTFTFLSEVSYYMYKKDLSGRLQDNLKYLGFNASTGGLVGIK